MNTNELVSAFCDARGYLRRLTIEGGAHRCVNSVRCVIEVGLGKEKTSHSSVHATSDEFFANNKDRFDIVVINGMHLCVQVLEDIRHSLDVLNKGGVVIVCRCIPNHRYTASPIPGGDDWCGDSYRAASWYFSQSPYLCYTVDADRGIGVVDTSRPASRRVKFPARYMCDLSFDEFNRRKKDLLNIILPDSVGSLIFRDGASSGAGGPDVPVAAASGSTPHGASVSALSSPAGGSGRCVSASAAAPASPEGVLVVPILNCRTGNNALQIYRGFWFAAVHGIPFENVRIKHTREIEESPALFSNIRGKTVTDAEIDAMPFYSIHCCPDSMPSHAEGRKALYNLALPERGAIAFTGAAFLYPELPWERSLFVRIFDNPEFRNKVAAEYEKALCGNTVGYQIRRGDFLMIPGRRRLTEDDVVADLSGIIRKHFGMVKIIVASDDPGFVESVLRRNEHLRKHVFHCTDSSMEKQLYLLSMCDYVIANGQYHCTSCWVNDPQLMWESTFGQVAQILSRSYKFAAYPPVPPDVAGGPTRDGCDCAYPTREVVSWR